jgi:hypothetical protein
MHRFVIKATKPLRSPSGKCSLPHPYTHTISPPNYALRPRLGLVLKLQADFGLSRAFSSKTFEGKPPMLLPSEWRFFISRD